MPHSSMGVYDCDSKARLGLWLALPGIPPRPEPQTDGIKEIRHAGNRHMWGSWYRWIPPMGG